MSKNEGTSEKEFVPIERLLTPSWAEETDEVHERDEKPKQAWAVQSTHDDAPSIASIQAEEAKKASEAAAKKGPYRPPQPKPSTPSYDYERSYDPPSRSERAPRERQPVPNEPPYTAFVGNLSYEVTEEHLNEYFKELGIVSVRLMKDPTGKPKGFGYIEFKTAEGLKDALQADDADFNGRKLNVDVAKPPSKLNTSWGPGSRDGGSNRPFRQGERENTSWGPGSRDSNRSSFRSTGTSNYKPPSTERPKLNLNPLPPKPEPRELTKDKPKGFSENPFGTAITDTEIVKMNTLAKERLERELERDAKRRADEEKRRVESERGFSKKPMSPREPEPSSTSSWRNNNTPKPSFTNREPNRGVEQRTKPSRPPVQVDSEGFREQGRSKEHRPELPTGSAARASQNEALSKQSNHVKTEQSTHNKVEKPNNRFAGLEEEQL